MRRILPFVIVAMVGIATLTSAVLLYRAKRPVTITTAPGVAKAETDRNPTRNVRGNPDAAVTLEEFGDFQCPPCSKLSEPINQIEKDFRPHVRIVFRHFPLINHSHAKEAAVVAEAAGEQGRFWEMHDLLYREQAVWSKATDVKDLFKSYAGMLRLNMDQFEKDLQSEKVQSRVAADQRQGTSIGVQNTPTIFLNNQAIDPQNLAPDKLRAAVDEAVKKSKPAS